LSAYKSTGTNVHLICFIIHASTFHIRGLFDSTQPNSEQQVIADSIHYQQVHYHRIHYQQVIADSIHYFKKTFSNADEDSLPKVVGDMIDEKKQAKRQREDEKAAKKLRDKGDVSTNTHAVAKKQWL
jgi:hypothetical protein